MGSRERLFSERLCFERLFAASEYLLCTANRFVVCGILFARVHVRVPRNAGDKQTYKQTYKQVPNTRAFHNITKIQDALDLHERLKRSLAQPYTHTARSTLNLDPLNCKSLGLRTGSRGPRGKRKIHSVNRGGEKSACGVQYCVVQ